MNLGLTLKTDREIQNMSKDNDENGISVGEKETDTGRKAVENSEGKIDLGLVISSDFEIEEALVDDIRMLYHAFITKIYEYLAHARIKSIEELKEKSPTYDSLANDLNFASEICEAVLKKDDVCAGEMTRELGECGKRFKLIAKALIDQDNAEIQFQVRYLIERRWLEGWFTERGL